MLWLERVVVRQRTVVLVVLWRQKAHYIAGDMAGLVVGIHGQHRWLELQSQLFQERPTGEILITRRLWHRSLVVKQDIPMVLRAPIK